MYDFFNLNFLGSEGLGLGLPHTHPQPLHCLKNIDFEHRWEIPSTIPLGWIYREEMYNLLQLSPFSSNMKMYYIMYISFFSGLNPLDGKDRGVNFDTCFSFL